ncbi:MAG: hypothetical protein H6508_00995 [Calditrichaeota bacterium]|nr:hypothetical protein [Calditrichota bacterium]MCB9365752.1 hypothetical protein [Calditrichota bacterium]
MDRKGWTLLLFSLMALGATLLTTVFQEKAHKSQMNRLNSAVDEAEKDIGIYDEETSRQESALKRALNVSREAQARAHETQDLLDSLTRANNEAMGYADPADAEETEGDGE